MPSKKQLTIVQPRETGFDAARAVGVSCVVQRVDPGNLDALLAPRLAAGDVLLNLSVDVSSVALMAWCQAHVVLYLDTCIEPWAGGYTLPGASNAARSNHALRQAALALHQPGPAPTAVITHAANPGLVSHFVEQAVPRRSGRPGHRARASGRRHAVAQLDADRWTDAWIRRDACGVAVDRSDPWQFSNLRVD